MEAGFEGTVCAWLWLSPILCWQKLKQTRCGGHHPQVWKPVLTTCPLLEGHHALCSLGQL